MEAPFLGSEALSSGELTRHELRRYYRAIMPNVYLDKRTQPSLYQRTHAAWLWSGREAVVAGLAASALHGAKWVDEDVPVELVWGNARTPRRVTTRADLILPGDCGRVGQLLVTSPERTAFDIGRRGSLDSAITHLDALAAATGCKVETVERLIPEHRGVRGLKQLRAALDLVDAGAESPQETRLRLLLIRAGYPRPRTQIPVLGPNGRPKYFLDMGWEESMLAVEYDGDHHRSDPIQFAHDIERMDYVTGIGWRIIRVAKGNRPAAVLRRVQAAWEANSTLR